MKTLIQLKQKDLKDIKTKWWEENNKECPILKLEFPLNDMVIDHQHKLKSELPDSTGKGICRGSIQRFANALEGKIWNNFKRMGLDRHISLPEFLRNLADYLEKNKINEDILYIHPLEEPKKPKLTKVSYNKLCKEIKLDGKVLPKYSTTLTKQLEKLFIKYNIQPEFYKD